LRPTASIVIPTRARPAYLDVALSSVMPQAIRADAEVIVVNDGDDPSTGAVAARHNAGIVGIERPSGVSAGRNLGAAASRGELIVLIDDDISAPPGWLDALLTGADAYPSHDVFGGPIRAVLEGGGPRACGAADHLARSWPPGPGCRARLGLQHGYPPTYIRDHRPV
jgi:glycosyltransferase involved in cell wall biosynthesis